MTPTRTEASSARSPSPLRDLVTVERIGERDDQELVTAALGGDRQALDTLLRRQYDRVHAVCRRITGSASDADDASQEAMIRIVGSLDRFDGRAAFSTWVYRIATNAALDELRRRKRRPTLRAVADDGSVPEPVDPRGEAGVAAVVERAALDEALADLALDFRAAVVLRDVADLDYAEIAAVLDVPIGTVRSRISRGRAQLATALGNPPPARERPTTATPDSSPGPPTPPTPPTPSSPTTPAP